MLLLILIFIYLFNKRDITIQLEKEVLSKVCSALRVDNAKISASNVSKIDNLQEDLPTENVIIDKLSQKTKKAKVLSVKLNYATTSLDHLEYEKKLYRSCISDINQYLQSLVETHHSMLPISVRQQLSEKLMPVFTLLNRLEGVSGSSSLLKQGGDHAGNNKKPANKNPNPNLSQNPMSIMKKNPKLTRRVMKLLGQKDKENDR